jgi:peptidoglycan-associated lipoprotein
MAHWLSTTTMITTLVAVGCAHTPRQETAPQSSAQPPSKPATPPADAVASAACTRDSDCKDSQLCIRRVCVDITADLAECGAVRIHFPFNSSEMEPPVLAALERSARCLRADRGLHVTIEGNADERGTEEFNLALGDKRAGVVASYLERLGASKAQLQTVSFGEENPLCVEKDEACYAKNRRAAIKPKPKGQK